MANTQSAIIQLVLSPPFLFLIAAIIMIFQIIKNKKIIEAQNGDIYQVQETSTRQKFLGVMWIILGIASVGISIVSILYTPSDRLLTNTISGAPAYVRFILGIMLVFIGYSYFRNWIGLKAKPQQ